MDTNELSKLLAAFIEEHGYSLSSLSFKKVKGQWTLALVIDRVKPIDMKAITEISEEISNYLDEINLIEEDNYLLDVSSLGAEKPLAIEDLALYKDSLVHVNLTNPIEGENIYQGKMVEVNEDEIVLEIKIKSRVKRVTLAKSNIRKIRLAISY